MELRSIDAAFSSCVSVECTDPNPTHFGSPLLYVVALRFLDPTKQQASIVRTSQQSFSTNNKTPTRQLRRLASRGHLFFCLLLIREIVSARSLVWIFVFVAVVAQLKPNAPQDTAMRRGRLIGNKETNDCLFSRLLLVDLASATHTNATFLSNYRTVRKNLNDQSKHFCLRRNRTEDCS